MTEGQKSTICCKRTYESRVTLRTRILSLLEWTGRDYMPIQGFPGHYGRRLSILKELMSEGIAERSMTYEFSYRLVAGNERDGYR